MGRKANVVASTKVKRKANVGSIVQIDAYAVIADAVSRGVEFGMNRAYKYASKPSRDAIVDSIETEVMNQISEVVRWPE